MESLDMNSYHGSDIWSDSKSDKDAYNSPRNEIQTTKTGPVYKLISMIDNAELDAKQQENAALWKEIENDLKKIRGSSVQLSEIPSVIERFLKRLQPEKTFKGLQLLQSFLDELISCSNKAEEVDCQDKKTTEKVFCQDEIFLEMAKKRGGATFYQNQVFPEIANLIINAKKIFSQTEIPILTQGSNKCIRLSEQQCACLIAHILMCVTINQGNNKLPCSYNFYEVLSTNNSKVAKLKLLCIFNYFVRLMPGNSPPKYSERYVVFEHLAYDKVIHGDDSLDAWKICKDKLTPIRIEPDGRIQDAQNATQVAFSDKILGDQLLQSMATQQSLMFFMSPELIIGCLFCEILTDYDALAIRGAKKFNNYSGAKRELKFEDWPDIPLTTEDKVLDSHVVLIDALNFKHYFTNKYQSNQENFQFQKTSGFEDAALKSQFSQQSILRELNKAYLGFFLKVSHRKPIATGKWGCGACGGNPPLKFIIQWIAASRAQRRILFYLFDGREDLKGVEEFLEYYKEKTVGELVRDLLKCCGNLPSDQTSDALWNIKEGSRAEQALEDLTKYHKNGLNTGLVKEGSYARKFLRELEFFYFMLSQTK